MFSRILTKPIVLNKSFFLFGPRGTGKTSWVKQHFPDALYFDLLSSKTYQYLLNDPSRLADAIPENFSNWIVVDEVQKIPSLLDEVHRLIEAHHYKFILTGSSARKLRRKGVNLLAGRALIFHMYPLTVLEMKNKFNFQNALQFGMLPAISSAPDPEEFLSSYVETYLKEEVLQEGLTRNFENFSRFLETASFSQGSPMNMNAIARECGISSKAVANYFDILNDLLMAFQLPIFTRHAKRRLMAHPKFYFFDVGVFRNIRPKGPFDLTEQLEGPALETLFLQELRALNDYLDFKYKIYYWQTSNGQEVDFVLYGERGLVAFEIKRKRSFDKKDLRSLKLFKADYPVAKCYLLYGGDMKEYHSDIQVLSFLEALQNLKELI